MSKSDMLYVGVDVSSKKLDMALLDGGKWLQTEFSNVDSGHAAMVRYLKKCTHQTLVCVEATGIYHLELCLALHGAANIEVMVISPRIGKDFSKAMMKRSKTDASDARMLAEYAQRMAFVAWNPPKGICLEIACDCKAYGCLESPVCG